LNERKKERKRDKKHIKSRQAIDHQQTPDTDWTRFQSTNNISFRPLTGNQHHWVFDNGTFSNQVWTIQNLLPSQTKEISFNSATIACEKAGAWQARTW
jgi:hypothetical protein